MQVASAALLRKRRLKMTCSPLEIFRVVRNPSSSSIKRLLIGNMSPAVEIDAPRELKKRSGQDKRNLPPVFWNGRFIAEPLRVSRETTCKEIAKARARHAALAHFTISVAENRRVCRINAERHWSGICVKIRVTEQINIGSVRRVQT